MQYVDPIDFYHFFQELPQGTDYTCNHLQSLLFLSQKAGFWFHSNFEFTGWPKHVRDPDIPFVIEQMVEQGSLVATKYPTPFGGIGSTYLRYKWANQNSFIVSERGDFLKKVCLLTTNPTILKSICIALYTKDILDAKALEDGHSSDVFDIPFIRYQMKNKNTIRKVYIQIRSILTPKILPLL